MVSPPLHVDALVAWCIRLAASHIKLRRFGPPGKSDPDEYAAAANRRKERFPSVRRKMDKYKFKPMAKWSALQPGSARDGPVPP